jgi:PAS domain S-box-containing protein
MVTKSAPAAKPAKQSQAGLPQSAELVQALLDSAGTGIYIVQEGKFVYVNPLFQELTGYTEKELIGTNCFSHVHPEDREVLRKQATETLKGESHLPYEYRFIKKNGDIMWILERVTSTEYRGKRAAAGSFMDITRRKEAERQLLIAETAIRTSVSAIASADLNGKLTYVNPAFLRIWGYDHPDEILGRSLASLCREEGKVQGLIQALLTGTSTGGAEVVAKKISNISHELRTPLHSIEGFTQLMLEGEATGPETQKKFLTIIDKQSARLRKLIDNLLDVSRLESGRFSIQKQRLSIKKTIYEAIEGLRSLASEKGMAINEDIPAELPEVEGDEERLTQVIVNLISNAIKFSPDGTGVTVKAEANDAELLAHVTDHGIGIPEQAMPHLFERFYRAKDSASIGGTGLGLYISKEIVEAHGGRMWAESKVGEGSTFSFSLPLNQDGGGSYE